MKRINLLRVFIALMILCFIASACQSAPVEPSAITVEMKLAFPNLEFERPLWMSQAPDKTGRWFLLEQEGIVRVFQNDRQANKATVFLDISAKVTRRHNEEGLLALAFHPDYKTNGLFYMYYSAASPRRSVLSEFRVSKSNPNRGDADYERVLLTVKQPWGNHNGGTLLFGPEGYLYLSCGDGGSAGDPYDNSQNLQSYLGKILRIDVNKKDDGKEYAVPKDNPFVGKDRTLPEIWAYGLRNVWRMSFDRETEELWAGDVGQNRYEEIDIVVKGGNYGWNYREGFHSFGHSEAKKTDTLIEPVAEYGRSLGISVTGGYVYRGEKIPALQGSYIYADYITGIIFHVTKNKSGEWENRVLLKQPKNIASFAEDEDGELYLLCFDGKIYELLKTKTAGNE